MQDKATSLFFFPKSLFKFNVIALLVQFKEATALSRI
jgi:hypothetical protein